jgi:hypothetical protein
MDRRSRGNHCMGTKDDFLAWRNSGRANAYEKAVRGIGYANGVFSSKKTR